jgi:hypothetical protein
MIIFYPITSVVVIFLNILLKPLSPQAKDDVDLLNTAPELIKAIRSRRLTPNEAVHMQIVEDFIAELARLANCAIQIACSDLCASNPTRAS